MIISLNTKNSGWYMMTVHYFFVINYLIAVLCKIYHNSAFAIEQQNILLIFFLYNKEP